MTGLYDKNEATQPVTMPAHEHGHNHPPEEDGAKWDRWAKERTFVRALKGTYSNLYEQLIDQPRVYKSRDEPWKGGPGLYGKHIISPQHANVTQSIETHIEVYAPGGLRPETWAFEQCRVFTSWRAGDMMCMMDGILNGKPAM